MEVGDFPSRPPSEAPRAQIPSPSKLLPSRIPEPEDEDEEEDELAFIPMNTTVETVSQVEEEGADSLHSPARRQPILTIDEREQTDPPQTSTDSEPTSIDAAKRTTGPTTPAAATTKYLTGMTSQTLTGAVILMAVVVFCVIPLLAYVLTVLYYHTGGSRWTFDLNFLKGHTHCGWYSILQYLDMSTEFRGVACDATTGKIYALFMSKHI